MNGDESLQLRDFVAETIKQVIDGVATAQVYAVKKASVVNPRTHPSSTPIQSISFDVAVTAAKGTTTQGGIAVFTGFIGLGSKGQSDKSNETINRIQFSVPVILPIGSHCTILENTSAFEDTE
jgi:hypothetical protein